MSVSRAPISLVCLRSLRCRWQIVQVDAPRPSPPGAGPFVDKLEKAEGGAAKWCQRVKQCHHYRRKQTTEAATNKFAAARIDSQCVETRAAALLTSPASGNRKLGTAAAIAKQLVNSFARLSNGCEWHSRTTFERFSLVA